MILQNSIYTLKFPARRTEIIVQNDHDRKELIKILTQANITYKAVSETAITIGLTAPKLFDRLQVATPLASMLKADLKTYTMISNF